jgi:hypothetical protein
VEAEEVTVAAEQCTRPNVQIVAEIVKFHSNQKKEDLYTAGIATKNTRNTDLSY